MPVILKSVLDFIFGGSWEIIIKEPRSTITLIMISFLSGLLIKDICGQREMRNSKKEVDLSKKEVDLLKIQIEELKNKLSEREKDILDNTESKKKNELKVDALLLVKEVREFIKQTDKSIDNIHSSSLQPDERYGNRSYLSIPNTNEMENNKQRIHELINKQIQQYNQEFNSRIKIIIESILSNLKNDSSEIKNTKHEKLKTPNNLKDIRDTVDFLETLARQLTN